MAAVAALWRHPIKSHGREPLTGVSLTAGQAMPWDRTWAVTHDNTRDDPESGWISCQNFMIGTRTPGLAGITAQFDEATGQITLTHQDLGSLTFDPDALGASSTLTAWTAPLCPADRARPVAIVRSKGGRGWTDTDFPSVTIMNRASHRAVSQRLGRPIEEERWRGNIWVDGLAPWEEREWIGKSIRIGAAVLTIREEVVRCLHTAANPVTGKRDTDTLGTLEDGWGHRNFGVYAEVTTGGDIRVGDPLEVL
ncbi:MOSC domain-containing protein [Marivivens marinus]|uniref:MOSC domain-containing protein n=1 Tax=Marivivens marinus TaxID=3110173 RepID=UPI003B8453C6